MQELERLSPQEFEKVVGLILQYEHHRIIREPVGRGVHHGPDYETVDPDGRNWLVEVKHFRKSAMLGRSNVEQFIGDVERYQLQSPDAKGLLVTSNTLSASALSAIAQSTAIEVWNGRQILQLLAKHPMIDAAISGIIEANVSIDSILQASALPVPASKSSVASTSLVDEMKAALKSLPCGKDGWRDYERLCTRILTHIFTPDLGTPDIQTRSDDGLEIMDAIFPMRSSLPPWSWIRAEYASRFVVAEFKNYCDPIGQRQVESIAQYLWHKAQRNFGLLVSRKEPSESAKAQRRKEWLNGRYIIFLSDDNLMEMLDLRENKEQPFDLVDAQIENFLRTLSQ
jgi:hypothetical protein